MKFFRTEQASLRNRLVLGVCVMLLPLLLVSLGGYLSNRRINGALGKVVRAEMRELDPVSRLQKLIYQAAMPVNDYIIHGNAGERGLFEELSRDIDESYRALLTAPELEEEAAFLAASRAEWELAREEGRTILREANPRGNRTLGARMESFDRHMDLAVDILSRVHEMVHVEIDAYLAGAQSVERNTTIFMVLAVGLGFVAAVVSGVLLARSITVPLGALRDGIFRFSQGDHSFRVVLDRRDELGQLAKTLNVMAERLEYDSLTGAYNRREFNRKLKIEIERSLRYGRTFSILMIDIDHFKSVNDTFGHQSGDEALRAVATIAYRELRSSDVLARYGGEEFAVVLPETPGKHARSVADRIRAQIASQPVMIPQGKVLNLTVSVGVAVFPGDAKSEDDLIAAADKALYIAKQGGRNRVVCFADSVSGPPAGT